ncbi:MAG: GNAT family N-acetyltransferase [Cyanobacteriota bacterium]|nr:GNAT family N-acetyltransferase [Cyanobacteriota bacterium]
MFFPSPHVPENDCACCLPVLGSQRLILRPFSLADAPDVQRLAGDRDLAAMTGLIPHPYEDGMAEAWIRSHSDSFERGKGLNYAVVLRDRQWLCGAIGFGINIANINAELGYWIGKPFWGQGYCTEAAQILLRYGFTSLKLHRIHASHFVKNPASGRVMQKIGMTYEGCLRQHVWKWGQFEDVEQYGILSSEWQSRRFGQK